MCAQRRRGRIRFVAFSHDVYRGSSPAHLPRKGHGSIKAAHGVSAKDFATVGTVYPIGLPPRRIDVLTSLSGVSFDEAIVSTICGHVGSQ